FNEALQEDDYQALIRQAFEPQENRQNSFAFLNTALFAGGLFIHIPSQLELETPIHLQFISEPAKSETSLAAFPRVVIVAEANSAATFIESYVASGDDFRYFTNAIIDLQVGDGARVRHYKVQREGLQAAHISNTRARLGRDSAYDTTTINLGAALSRHDISVT